MSSFCLVYLCLSICYIIFTFLMDLCHVKHHSTGLWTDLRTPFKQKTYRCQVLRFQWALFCSSLVLTNIIFPSVSNEEFSLNLKNCSPRFTKVTNTEAHRGAQAGQCFSRLFSGGKNSVVSSIVSNVFALKQISASIFVF